MSLPKRLLGSSGVKITTIGFGAWAIGGGGWAFSWGPQDDDASLATMRHAIDLGVTWIDTAAVYGLGHSEEVIGRLLRSLPAFGHPLVFTKCGLVWDERNPMAEPRRVLKPESIRRDVRRARQRRQDVLLHVVGADASAHQRHGDLDRADVIEPSG